MATHPNLQRLHEAGVSIWLDTLSRQLLASGEFAELIRAHAPVDDRRLADPDVPLADLIPITESSSA